MDVTCIHCQHSLYLPDEKLPKDRAFAITCPKCKKKWTIDPQASPASAPSASGDDDGDAADETNGGAPKNPFEFLEEGVKTAAICESSAAVIAKIKPAVEALGYRTTEPKSDRDALRQMRFHDFDLVIINELFGARDPDMNHVLKYLSQLNMAIRRRMFVALLTSRFSSADNMIAFNKSVNLIVNLKDVDQFGKILKRGINENNAFYHVFKEVYAKIKGY